MASRQHNRDIFVDAAVKDDGTFRFSLEIDDATTNVQVVQLGMKWDEAAAVDDDVFYWCIEFDSVFVPQYTANNLPGNVIPIMNSPDEQRAAGSRVYSYWRFTPHLSLTETGPGDMQSGAIIEGRIYTFDPSDVAEFGNGLSAHLTKTTTLGGDKVTPDHIAIVMRADRVEDHSLY